MHLHHFTLSRLSVCLSNRFAGYRLACCFSQDKDELVLGFENGKDEFFLRVNCSHAFPFIWPATEYPRARRNVADLFPSILGRKVMEWGTVKWDRTFFIRLEGDAVIWLKMHGNRSNVILQEPGGVKLFRQSISSDLSFVPAPGRWNEYSGEEALPLREISPVLDRFFETRLGELKSLGLSFSDSLSRLLAEAADGGSFLSLPPAPLRFVLFPLSGTVPLPGDVFDALQVFFRARMRFDHYQRQYDSVSRSLAGQLQQSEAQSRNYQANLHALETERNPEEIGNLLMANLHVIQQGMKSVTLFDFYRDTEITIPLREEWTAQQNAEHHYRKQKQRRAQLARLRELVTEAAEKHRQAMEIRSAFDSLTSPASLVWKGDSWNLAPFRAWKEFVSRYSVILESATQQGAEKETRFHRFECDGFTILCGRNAKNNDELTLHTARKDDLWLHAKDTAGSHVIIRNPGGKTVPAHVIEFAAAIAARNSKRKSERLVPVSYTPRKFVRKAKGMAPGEVAVDREKVILVEPAG